jgi:hypothetical protein
MSGTIGPLLRHPQKWPFSRSQLSSAPGPTPLGADRGSSAFSRHAQVLPQRGMAFAPEHGHQLLALGSNYAIHGVGLPGSTMAIMVPSRGPPKTGDLQGKAAESGVRALWGQQWTRLPFTPGASTATTGAWGSLQPASCVAAPRGPRRRIMAPPAGPPESRPLQGKSRRVREVRALCGTAMDSSALERVPRSAGVSTLTRASEGCQKGRPVALRARQLHAAVLGPG